LIFMVEAVIGKFEDKTVGVGRGEILRYTFREDGRVYKYYHYVSGECIVELYNGSKKVFPDEGGIKAYGIFIVFDFPEPIEFRAGETLIVRYDNVSGGNVRVISAFTGISSS